MTNSGDLGVTAGEAKVVEAFSGSPWGKTVDQALKSRGAPSRSTIEHKIKGLVKRGLLVQVSPLGTKPALYKPSYEVQVPRQGTQGGKAKSPRSVDPSLATEDNCVGLAIQRAMEIVRHINETKAWSSSRRTRAICQREIAPFLGSLKFLKESGHSVVMPEDYTPFFEERPRSFWRGIVGSAAIPGVLSVLRPSTKVYRPANGTAPMKPRGLMTLGDLKKDGSTAFAPLGKLSGIAAMDGGKSYFLAPDGNIFETTNGEIPWVVPSLLEWREYLKAVVEELKDSPS